LRDLVGNGIDSVFALAATLTVESEADFRLGLDVNLHGLIALLETLREGARCPRVVFTSSLAAFGGPLPEIVDDSVPLAPQTSYGTQKAIGELLINDYSRHGFIDGRCLRLPIVMTRHDGVDAPPPAQRAPTISGAIASLVGDRLLGRDIVCPLGGDTRIAVASAGCVIDALIKVHELSSDAFGHFRSMNLPSLSLTLAELAAASGRTAERAGVAPGALAWQPEARFQQAVDQWPKRFESARASRAGIAADPDADAIVAAYLRDNPRALEQSAKLADPD
jgi:nucleoside-diphosphate-sugar epimerase